MATAQRGNGRLIGGVAARMAPAPTPAQPGDLQAASRGAASTDAGFVYQGGPIIAHPQVYASFWGAAWSEAANAHRQADLIQFLQDLLASDYMNILSQYGVGHGAGQAGTWESATNVAAVSGQLSDAAIHGHIQAMIDAGTVAEPAAPSNTALMIFLAEGVEVSDPALGVVMCEPHGDTAFGYHNFFTTTAGRQCYYSIIPALDDTCLAESCPQDSGCSLHLAATQEQRQTQVASHEFSEMVTDPEINAWRDPANGNENGDICNGQNGTITVGGRTWTVQRMYSHVDDQRGDTACVLGPAQPIPSQLPSGASPRDARRHH